MILRPRLNPVLVREIRQAVRSRFVTVMLLLELLLLLAWCLYKLVLLSDPNGIDTDLVRNLFEGVVLINFTLAAPAVCLHGAGRLVAERLREDLMYSSAIRPITIATGKFLSALVLSVLFFSMALPFMAFIYLLRGIDLRILFFGFFGSFLLVQTLHGLFLVSLAGGRSALDIGGRTVALLLMVGVSLWLFVLMIIFTIISGTEEIFIFVLSVYGLFLFLTVPIVSLLLTACQFAPISSNRMFATRIVATVLTIVLLAICVLQKEVCVAVNLLSFLFLFFCFVTVCERSGYGLRYRAGIPNNPLLRLLAFPFYTGDWNAVLWLLSTVILGGFVVIFSGVLSENNMDRILPDLSNYLFAFDYAVLSVFLRNMSRRFEWSKRISRLMRRKRIGNGPSNLSEPTNESTWIIMVALLVAGVVLSAVWSFIRYEEACDRWQEMLFFVPNPFWFLGEVVNDTEASFQFIVASVVFLLLLPPVFLCIAHRLDRFKPIEPEK